ncbi:MAG TPA: sulfotransferase family 2 domain-containing protein [Terriglobales bacterium]|nr:sulfotransferase family 2 domain-containing protein [Terriglobales bacterium]
MLNVLRAGAAELRFRPNPGPRIVFFHLPRTGGTSLSKDILFPNFPRSRWCNVNFAPEMEPLDGAHRPLMWPAWRRKRIQLLAGHMPFGFALHFPGPSEYITLVRDPIARTISDYYFCRNNPANPAHEAAIRLSLVEFVERGHAFTQNCYARWLSNEPFGAYFRDPDEMLRRALSNLSQFSFIGITEQFEVAVQRLCERYGLVPHAATKVNRNAATPEARAVSAEEHEVLRRANALDLVIYEECLRRFARSEAVAASA